MSISEFVCVCRFSLEKQSFLLDFTEGFDYEGIQKWLLLFKYIAVR